MKKIAIIVFAIVALTGMFSIASAEFVLFQDYWTQPFTLFQGEHQNDPGYGGPVYYPNALRIVSEIDPADPLNNVSLIEYDKHYTLPPASPTHGEGWSSKIIEVGATNLAGCTNLSFRIRKGPLGVNINVDKIFMKDSNNAEFALNNITVTPSWAPYFISLAGANLAQVKNLFGILITASSNTGITGDLVSFYIDDVKYEGGSGGAVIVTMVNGIVGASIEQSIDYDVILPLATNTSYSSVDIGGGPTGTKNHFIVTNIGSQSSLFSLNLVNPAGWTAYEAPLAATTTLSLGRDIYALWAGFCATTEAPTLSDLTIYNTEDLVKTTQSFSDGTIYAIGSVSGENGYGVAGTQTLPVGPRSRSLYVCFRTPSFTSVASTQSIILVVSANEI